MLAIQAAHQLIKLLGRRRIQPGHRLVQQQQRIRSAQRARQPHALLLTARKRPIGRAPQILNIQQAQLFPRLFPQRPAIEEAPAQLIGAARQHDLFDRRRKIPLRHGLLRQIADLRAPEPVAIEYLPAAHAHQPQHGAHQRALAGAVFANDHQIIAAPDLKRYVFDRSNAVKGDGDILYRDQRHLPLPPSSALHSCRICPPARSRADPARSRDPRKYAAASA